MRLIAAALLMLAATCAHAQIVSTNPPNCDLAITASPASNDTFTFQVLNRSNATCAGYFVAPGTLTPQNAPQTPQVRASAGLRSFHPWHAFVGFNVTGGACDTFEAPNRRGAGWPLWGSCRFTLAPQAGLTVTVALARTSLYNDDPARCLPATVADVFVSGNGMYYVVNDTNPQDNGVSSCPGGVALHWNQPEAIAAAAPIDGAAALLR